MSESHSNEKKFPGFTIKDNVIIGDEIQEKETRSLPKFLFDSMSEASDRLAIIDADTDEKVTYAQMKDRSVRCAVWLKKQGITKDDIISISTPSQMHDYIPYFATYYLNAINSPWHYKFTKESAKYYLDLMKPKVVFAWEKSIDTLAEVAEDLNIDCKFVVFGKHPKFESLEDILAQQTQEEVDRFTYIESEDPRNQVALMLFTSGTTGNPKAIMTSYYSLVFKIELRKNLTGLWYTPLLWTSGALFSLSCAYAQNTRVVHAEFDTNGISKVIEKYKVNWMFFTPLGGSFISKEVLAEVQNALPHAFVSNGYGQSEVGGPISGVNRYCKKTTSVGHIAKGMQLKIVDLKTGKALGPNENGEICLKNDRMMIGYYKNSEATKKTIDKDGWLHTGDLGNYDEDGEITLLSRIKDVVITQHFQLFLSEIEAILLQHPEVKEAAVTSVPHEADGQRPIAFVVKTPGAKVTSEELQEIPGNYNKFYRISGGVVFVDHLPYTATEKVKISELKEWAKKYAK